MSVIIASKPKKAGEKTPAKASAQETKESKSKKGKKEE